MACAFALKNIEILEREQLTENAEKMGRVLLEGFQRIQSERKIVGKVKGLGLMGGIELVKDIETMEKFSEPVAPMVVNEAAKRGLICRSVVFDGQDTVVLAPPLIITKEEIEKLINILNEAIAAVEEFELK
ncbi:aspartate aminotransferase family protein [Bacillus sp. S/N-304-OC-R1]|nr:aspartate aminotransferase family protein [Bacillus sp. S/N-304-OC-R1]